MDKRAIHIFMIFMFNASAQPSIQAEINGLSVEPANSCTFLGPPGGPFNPDTCHFDLVNSTDQAISVEANFSVLYEPPWLQGFLNNSTTPLNASEVTIVEVPANSSIRATLSLTETVSEVTDPNNEGLFGGISFADPNFPQNQLSIDGSLQFIDSNDDLAGARLLIPVDGSVSGSNEGATKQDNEPNHAANNGGASVWWRYQAPNGASGSVSINTQFSSIDTLLAVYTGSDIDNLLLVAENDDVNSQDSTSALTFDILQGQTYFIAVDGADRGAGPQVGGYNLLLTENLEIGNDAFSNAIQLHNLQGSVDQFSSPSTFPTREPNEPPHGGGFGGSVWYQWIAPATAVYRFTAGEPAPSSFPTISIYLGDSVDKLIEVASTTIFADATNLLDVLLYQGADYKIALSGGSSSVPYPLEWSIPNPQPTTGLVSSILPSSRAVQLGQPATVFANIFNASDELGENCRPEPPNHLNQFTPSGFSYQTADAQNNLIGTANTPANIPAGNVQNWIVEMISPVVISQGALGVRFTCDNLLAAPVFSEANVWRLRVLNIVPADIIAIAASSGDPGTVTVPLSGSNAFAIAGVNIGSTQNITVRAKATNSNNVTISVCETDSTSNCLNTPASEIEIANFANAEVRTFAVFVQSDGQPITLNPGFERISVVFLQQEIDVGGTSMALETSSN